MYTSQQSVENKVGGIPGWQALLTAVGFRLDPAASGLPAAVFFPTSDPGDRLQQCSSTLQALLGKPPVYGGVLAPPGLCPGLGDESGQVPGRSCHQQLCFWQNHRAIRLTQAHHHLGSRLSGHHNCGRMKHSTRVPLLWRPHVPVPGHTRTCRWPGQPVANHPPG